MRRVVFPSIIVLGVLVAWVHSLGLRLPYMDQIPVFDADATTGEATMWTRMWWNEGPLKMWFSTPFAPASVEGPPRVLYASWPPGAFIVVYLIAVLLGTEPSIPMVNWVNTCEHGLIALAAAFIAFNVALMNRFGKISSALIAIGVTFPILFSRGPIYVFSQIYDVTNAVLVFTTAFILLETIFYSVESARDKSIVTTLQLVTIVVAFAVDWLPYTLFGFWLLSRLAAGYLGIEKRMRLRRLVGLALLPIGAFMLYLGWRFFAPDSYAGTNGIGASISYLLFNLKERMNLGNVHPVSGFTEAFIGEMHSVYYSADAFWLIVVSALVTMALVLISFRSARHPAERRAVFATGSILFLVTIPFYAHMLILQQHTFIHRWAIMKAMFAYALVPFALLPICIFSLVRQFAGEYPLMRRAGLPIAGLLLALSAISGAKAITNEHWYLLGRVDRASYKMWDDIGRNVRFKDVVVSPVLSVRPMSPQVGVTLKLVHPAKDFAEVDKLVDHVCGDFNVVLLLPQGVDEGAFASRQPTEVIDTGRIRLLRFAHFGGKAIGCS